MKFVIVPFGNTSMKNRQFFFFCEKPLTDSKTSDLYGPYFLGGPILMKFVAEYLLVIPCSKF